MTATTPRTPARLRAFEYARELAADLGAEHAKAAATWTVDGNTKPEAVARVLELIDEGDDVDDYLPRRPNLSGEYADDLTPARLAAELGIDPDDGELVEAACDAYDDAVAEHFAPACEAELRAAA